MIGGEPQYKFMAGLLAKVDIRQIVTHGMKRLIPFIVGATVRVI